MLTPEERLRYRRQLIMPAVGEAGQEKLKTARAFIAGLGGLGSVSACYLTAAGIGCLRIVDRDRVELHNLNRQILHRSGDIGRTKVKSAETKLRELNPGVRIEPVEEEITGDNVFDLVGECSIIIDATDNMETRRILNRASLVRRIPFVCAGVDNLNGMVTTLVPGRSPCFECIFPGDSFYGGEIGVIGPLPGIVASMQALEAMKVILEMEGTLEGRLLLFSGADMTFREVRIEKNPECEVCATVRVMK